MGGWAVAGGGTSDIENRADPVDMGYLPERMGCDKAVSCDVNMVVILRRQMKGHFVDEGT